MPRDGERIIQADVARLVAGRGYLEGWTPETVVLANVFTDDPLHRPDLFPRLFFSLRPQTWLHTPA